MRINFLTYFKFIHSYAKKHRYLFIGVLVLSILISFTNLVNPIASRMIIDKVLIGSDQSLIVQIALVILGLFVVVAIINVLMSFLKAWFTNKVDYAVKLDFFDKLQKSLFSNNISKYSGEVYYRMFKDGSFLVSYYLKLTLDLVINIILMSVIIVLMMQWSLILTALSMLMVIMQIGLVVFFKKPLTNIINKQREIEQDLSANVNQSFNESEITKLLGLEDRQYDFMDEKFNSVIKISVKNVFLQSVMAQISSFSNQLWSAILLVLGSAIVLNGNMSIGTLMGFYMLINSFYFPALSIVSTVYAYPETKVSFRRFMDYYKGADPSYDSKIPFSFKNNIKLNSLGFIYHDGSKHVFKDINLAAYPGEVIAVVGESGSGKSTLIRIISRLLLPTEGYVTIDDINISKINIKDYRKNIGVLSQTPMLLNDTLRNNVALWNKDITDEEIYLTLQRVGLAKFYNEGQDDLNTMLGVKGKKISQGENQRINLARLLIQKPKIIILDEPTSSLDKDTEKLILETLVEFRNKSGCLIIMITHSQNSLEYADRIINLDNMQ